MSSKMSVWVAPWGVGVGVGVTVGVGVAVGVGVGVAVGPLPMVTVMPAEGVSRLPLSSTARLRMFTDPTAPVVHEYVQLLVPLVAGCHVTPAFVDTSMPATTPPPASVAVPLIVTWVPGRKLAPFDGA